MDFISVRGLIFACILFDFCWGLSWCSFPNGVAYMSFPGKVIENRWFVSLSCLRTQVLVRVPNFFLLYFWKMRSKAASRARARAGSSHWVASPTLQPLVHHSSFDISRFWMEFNSVLGLFFACANLRFFLLRVVVVVVSNCCRLHAVSRKSNWESLVRQSQLLASTSFGSCSQLFLIIFLKMISKAAGRGRSCAGSSHWISSPTP